MKKNTSSVGYERICSVDDCARVVGRHGAKGYCSKHYKRFKAHGDPLGFASKPALPDKYCVVDGCGKEARSKSADYCGKHYHRLYRHGRVDVNFDSVSVREPTKYRIVELPEHPVAGASGKAYVHRVVLYDSIGGGTHACHWCEKKITWMRGVGVEDDLTVDHLNGVRDDNRIENLVPSCIKCNTSRGAQRRHKILKAEHGAWAVNDTIARLKSGRAWNEKFEEVAE